MRSNFAIPYSSDSHVECAVLAIRMDIHLIFSTYHHLDSTILFWDSFHNLFPGTGETLKLNDEQLSSPNRRTMLGKRWRLSSHGMNHKRWKHFRTNTLSSASFLVGVQELLWSFANPKNVMVLSTK